jgi:uncharacterized membrane protein YdjX (TVP38/TMEM64 family)
MKIKWRRSTWILLSMLFYVTATAIYLLPHNLVETSKEKLITVFVSYIIVVLLWFVLRKKENSQRERNKENSIN